MSRALLSCDMVSAFPCSLKDDDSGDHEQNEENSAQKDGEKEKAEREKGQGSSKRKVSRLSLHLGLVSSWDLPTWQVAPAGEYLTVIVSGTVCAGIHWPT